MKFVQEKCSIECHAANIISRKIMVNSYIEIKRIGRCRTYKCKRNSEAHITKTLPHPCEPIYKTSSAVGIGDFLECEDLYLAINNMKTLKVTKNPHTGTHNAQFTSTDCYTYAEISRRIPGIPDRTISQPKVIAGP